jgi:hypothetical protein
MYEKYIMLWWKNWSFRIWCTFMFSAPLNMKRGSSSSLYVWMCSSLVPEQFYGFYSYLLFKSLSIIGHCMVEMTFYLQKWELLRWITPKTKWRFSWKPLIIMIFSNLWIPSPWIKLHWWTDDDDVCTKCSFFGQQTISLQKHQVLVRNRRTVYKCKILYEHAEFASKCAITQIYSMRPEMVCQDVRLYIQVNDVDCQEHNAQGQKVPTQCDIPILWCTRWKMKHPQQQYIRTEHKCWFPFL